MAATAAEPVTAEAADDPEGGAVGATAVRQEARDAAELKLAGT